MKLVLGPPTPCISYANWRWSQIATEKGGVSEARLYTDAHIVGGHVSIGPYTFLNTFAMISRFGKIGAVPAVVLRFSYNVPRREPTVDMVSDHRHYHGGDLMDEIAALCSLFMGVRLKAGDISREFDDRDPLGSPLETRTKPEPPPLHTNIRPIIPCLTVGTHNLDSLTLIQRFPDLSVVDANAVVKAARLYQEALWIADSDPSQAWLMLVSAIETASQQCGNSETSERDLVDACMPELVELLKSGGNEELLDKAYPLLLRFTNKPTAKFISFIADKAPSPPEYRPPEAFQFRYSKTNLKKAARRIYDHRSRSLHDGTAFPLPMCYPPQELPSSEPQSEADEKVTTYSEIVPGLAMRAREAQWTTEDTPMMLHTFEHIARGALLRWFSTLPAEPRPA